MEHDTQRLKVVIFHLSFGLFLVKYADVHKMLGASGSPGDDWTLGVAAIDWSLQPFEAIRVTPSRRKRSVTRNTWLMRTAHLSNAKHVGLATAFSIAAWFWNPTAAGSAGLCKSVGSSLYALLVFFVFGHLSGAGCNQGSKCVILCTHLQQVVVLNFPQNLGPWFDQSNSDSFPEVWLWMSAACRAFIVFGGYMLHCSHQHGQRERIWMGCVETWAVGWVSDFFPSSIRIMTPEDPKKPRWSDGFVPSTGCWLSSAINPPNSCCVLQQRGCFTDCRNGAVGVSTAQRWQVCPSKSTAEAEIFSDWS